MGKRKPTTDRSFISSEEILEISGVMFVALNRDGIVILINRKGSEILGSPKEEIIGKEWFGHFLPKKNQKAVRDVFAKMMSGEMEAQEYYVNPVQTKTGEERNIFWHNTILKNEEGGIIGTLSSGEDISDREKIELLLQESEDRYKALFERSTEGILIADVETRHFVFANPAICSLFGYTEFEWKEMGVQDIHPQENLDHVISEFDAQAKGEKVIAYMIPCMKKSGELIYANVSTTPIIIGGRKCNVGFFTDMTEKKRISELMEESEKKYRTIFNSVNVGLLIFNFDGVIKDVNPFFSQIYGYSREEAIGMNAIKLFHPDFREHLHDCIVSVKKSGHFYGETIDIHKDGTLINVEGRGSLITLKGEKFMLAILNDITRQKKTEAELKKSESQYRTLIETSPTAIAMGDLEGNLIFVNEYLAKMHGFKDSEELLKRAKNIKDLVDPSDHELLKDELKKVVIEYYSDMSEFRLIKMDGSLLIADVVAAQIKGDDGSPIGFMAVAIDRTEHKLVTEQLRQAQKMEAVGQLAGGIAHDFNNLLQIIRGYAELSLRGLDIGHPVREFLEEIGKAERRGSKLVDQLLVFSRKQVMKPQNLNLNAVVSDHLRMLKRIIGEHICLRFSAAEGLMNILADRGMMELVLMNLCVNARDAMPSGGDLKMKTENVTIDEEFCKTQTWAVPGNYILLSVSDTGCGIAPDLIQHIFEPFFSTKESGKGTGLGLSTVYGIIKQHDGMISVSSEPGRGTVFEIHIPAVMPGGREEVTSRSDKVEGGGETILYAEDNEMVRDLTCRILKEAGYKVITAVNGIKAVSLYNKYADKVDALLFDVMMPNMSGYEAFKKIGINSPGIPILFVSGYSENTIQTNFAMDENLKIIRKPYSREELLLALREIIDKQEGPITQ